MNNLKNKKFILISAALLVLFLLPMITNAAFDQGFFEGMKQAGVSGSYEATDNQNYLTDLIGSIIGTIIGLIGSVFLILIIYSGWQWLTAGGEEGKIDKAKTRIKNSVIGVGVCLLAFGIALFVNTMIQDRFLTTPVPQVETPSETINCTVQAHCADQLIRKICDTSLGICVQCLNALDCVDNGQVVTGSECNNGLCSEPASTCASITDKTECSLQETTCNWDIAGKKCVPVLTSGCSKCDTTDGCWSGQCGKECSDTDQCAWYELTCTASGNVNGICKTL